MKIDAKIEAYKTKLIQEYHSKELLLMEYQELCEEVEYCRNFIAKHNIIENGLLYEELKSTIKKRDYVGNKILEIFRKEINEYECN